MAKNPGPSWKKNHPGTFFSNSVEKADRAVKQAMSHPEEMAIEHAFNSIETAENAYTNAEQFNVHLDNVQLHKDQLDSLKQQLNETHKKNG
ncbi:MULTISPECIES: DUF2564 family protein [unclassified Sporosarcina]|uniref:DUF2564 family protein n=1 Tax=unclassified Sporosarcina TaxID=2647733 RepID=UPI00203B6B16|nr:MULTISPECIES: DUF2564 family protein [unclassified Sporosarcina]GKV67279.1 hypothetical protein NCCP2331_34320 [Sporosarcina sp. NCCP-2331]GLB57624.1 hypothetical protein NCCP2378_34140 [Sporosarcina sp. NCCP-2378]